MTDTPGIQFLSDSGPGAVDCNPRTRWAMSPDQSHAGKGTVVSRRVGKNVAIQDPNDPNKQIMVPAAQLGLRERPVMVQRGADRGTPENPIAQAPLEVLTTDGTSKGHLRMNEEGVTRPLSLPPGDPVPERVIQQPNQLAAPTFTPTAAPTSPVAQALKEQLGDSASMGQAMFAQAARQGKKVKVSFSGAGMGKTTVFAREAIVSPTLVVIAYPQDGESAIVEPPECGTDAPIQITVGNQTYPCIYGGWTYELDGLLFLVLVRIT